MTYAAPDLRHGSEADRGGGDDLGHTNRSVCANPCRREPGRYRIGTRCSVRLADRKTTRRLDRAVSCDNDPDRRNWLSATAVRLGPGPRRRNDPARADGYGRPRALPISCRRRMACDLRYSGGGIALSELLRRRGPGVPKGAD